MSNVLTLKVNKHRQLREVLLETVETSQDEELVDKIVELLDKTAQDAFRRGLAAGHKGTPYRGEFDSVYYAQNAKIEDPDTLANLYSKEQGFKE